MKKSITLLLTLLLVNALSIFSQTDTCLVDLNYNSTQYPSATPRWNNLTPGSVNSINQVLNNVLGDSIGHVVSSGWVSANNVGAATTTFPAALDFTQTQIQDNFYGQTGAGVLTLSGLNPNKLYSFTIIGSRDAKTDNRTTLYVLNGLNKDSATLNASSNTANVAVVYNIAPTAQGVIVFNSKLGSGNNAGYFYLAAFKMLISSSPIVTSIVSAKDSETPVSYNNGVLSLGNLTGEVSLYTTTGKLAAKGNAVAGNLKIDIVKGVYIVRSGGFASKLIVK